MDSLRDQLAKLFPKLATGTPEGKSRVERATPASGRRTNVPQGDDWKDGVTPLSPTNRADHKANLPKVEELAPRRSRDFPKQQHVAKRETLAPRSVREPAKGNLPAPAPSSASKLSSEQLTPHRHAANPVKFGGIDVPALTRSKDFKQPETWIAAGGELQPPNGGGGPVLPVLIGIDFGTAYTKAAIRVGLADRQVHFVPWSGVRSGDGTHYLPGEISISQEGAVWLGRCPDAVELRTELKLPFLDRNMRAREQFGAAVAFIAWVMRYSRAWLYATQPTLIRDRTLAWEVNIGCPTDSWSERDIRFSYEALGVFAWQLSQKYGDIHWDDALSIAQQGKPSLDSVGLDAFNVMPEFVAQIAGYVQSPQRQDGLHLLMDVGAGTVDLASFNVGPNSTAEGDRYDIFASRVLPMGTHYLMAKRSKDAGVAAEDWDDFRVVPDGKKFAEMTGASVENVTLADAQFGETLIADLAVLLGHVRTKRYGKAPEWQRGLRTFLSGGGRDCAVYANALAAAYQRQGIPLKRTPFPLLEEAAALGDVGSENFHRLSVAYGLTFDAEAVGQILAPHEIADAPRLDPNVDKPRERPDRDDLYPK